MSNLYLDRDVPSEDSSRPDDVSPVYVPEVFKKVINDALEIAIDACTDLSKYENPKLSAVDFWCDMVATLKFLVKDIQMAEVEIPQEREQENG